MRCEECIRYVSNYWISEFGDGMKKAIEDINTHIKEFPDHRDYMRQVHYECTRRAIESAMCDKGKEEGKK